MTVMLTLVMRKREFSTSNIRYLLSEMCDEDLLAFDGDRYVMTEIGWQRLKEFYSEMKLPESRASSIAEIKRVCYLYPNRDDLNDSGKNSFELKEESKI